MMLKTNADGSNDDELRRQVDMLVSPLLTQHPQIGLAVGLLHNDRSWVYGYGITNATQIIAPNATTMFELCSITKVFTAILLAKMVEDGYVSFDQPVHTLLPEECPHFPQEITLLQLATHTSGLPRLPENLSETPGFDPRNPYAHYTSAHLYAYLATYRNDREGTQPAPYAYSNLGTGLLGDILARKLGQSYEQAIMQNICVPLGMTDTRCHLTTEQQKRLATPHTVTGEPTLNWDIPALAGAGALRSTAQDMLTFLAANVGDGSGPLQSVLRRCHEIVIKDPLPGSNLAGIASGWHVNQLRETGKVMHWHNGKTGGYRTFMGLQKECQSGVIILSNHTETNIDPIGVSLLNQLVHASEKTR